MGKRAEGESAHEAPALEPDADGSGSVKRQRVVEGGADGGSGSGSAAEAKADVCLDPLKVLPDDLVRHIVSYLPLKQLVRMSVLSMAWREFLDVRVRSARYDIRARVLPSVPGLLAILQAQAEAAAGPCLDSLAIIVRTCMKISHLRRIVEMAMKCGVVDLHIELHNPNVAAKARFHFPILSTALVCLSLHQIVISKMCFTDERRFDKLTSIHFHSVTVDGYIFRRVIARCPSLRVLDLRRCSSLEFIAIPPVGPMLTRLTIVDCNDLERVDVVSATSLRSVFYSGRFLSSFYLPRTRDASFTDLYICYDGPVIPQVFGKWSQSALPKLSNLSNLTICSNALKIVSSVPRLPHEERPAQLDWLGGFGCLTELQLLMFEIKALNVADIFEFLRSFQFPNLTNLFLQLPRIREDEPESASEHDVLESESEDVTEYGLDKLRVARIMNFNGRSSIEIQIVRFLLREARNVNSLQLVAAPHNGLPWSLLVQQGDIIHEAFANGVIQVSPSDKGTTQPCHSEVFKKF